MKYEPNNIISRIEWCQRQQHLHSVTMDERAGWRAEEAGLVDALGRRDRRLFMKEEYGSNFIRYQCGLEDGRALLRLHRLHPSSLMRMKELGPAPLTTQAWVSRPSSQASSRVHVGRSRR
jgi:hypothetical protein